MSDSIDPARCPLCGEGNHCGMVEGSAKCWCYDLAIAPEVLERIPAEAKGVACVCQKCITEGARTDANSSGFLQLRKR